MDISVKALEEAVSIRRQIDNLERRLSSILGGAPARPAVTASAAQSARYFSPSTRAKLAAAARARWARLKGGAKPAPTRKKRRTHGCWSKKAVRANEGPLGSKKKVRRNKSIRRNKSSSFSEERWTHSCRATKTLPVDEGSLGSATESFRAQVIEQYKRKRRVADSFRFPNKVGGGRPKDCSREDSNLHGFPHTVLSRTRLPIPPREQNQWSLQCAGANRLQDQTGDDRRKEVRKSRRAFLPCANLQLVSFPYLAE